MSKIRFQKRDIEKILEVINSFPYSEGNHNYILKYDGSSGIGYCIDLILETEINGVKGEFKIPIAGVEDW